MKGNRSHVQRREWETHSLELLQSLQRQALSILLPPCLNTLLLLGGDFFFPEIKELWVTAFALANNRDAAWCISKKLFDRFKSKEARPQFLNLMPRWSKIPVTSLGSACYS